jgi:competence protein ComFC
LISFRRCSETLLNILFPPLCVHCNLLLDESSKIFCRDCLTLVNLIDPLERCPYCFSADYHPELRVCEECQKRAPVLDRVASAFDYIGPAATMLKLFKYGQQKYLAKGCSAYLAAQFSRLDWPMPDVIVPVPIAFNHWVQRGYNQCELLADNVGEILDRPVVHALRRKSGDYSQAGLSRSQRFQLIGNTFELKGGYSFHDKTILLIDDVLTTGTTLKKCAEILFEAYPSRVYALTLCRAIK